MNIPPTRPNRLPIEGEWKRRNRRTRHACVDYALTLVPDNIEDGDRWRCPTCNRRWQVTPCRDEYGFSPQPYEGVYWNGPDGSQYWRPYRARFIGYPFGL